MTLSDIILHCNHYVDRFERNLWTTLNVEALAIYQIKAKDMAGALVDNGQHHS